MDFTGLLDINFKHIMENDYIEFKEAIVVLTNYGYKLKLVKGLGRIIYMPDEAGFFILNHFTKTVIKINKTTVDKLRVVSLLTNQIYTEDINKYKDWR